MTFEQHNKNYRDKIYHVECLCCIKICGETRCNWIRWSGYRKAKQALDAIRDIRRNTPNWKFRIKIRT